MVMGDGTCGKEEGSYFLLVLLYQERCSFSAIITVLYQPKGIVAKGKVRDEKRKEM